MGIKVSNKQKIDQNSNKMNWKETRAIEQKRKNQNSTKNKK